MTEDKNSTADTAPTEDPAPTPESWHTKVWGRLHWEAYYWLPKLIPYPDRRDADYYRANEPEENAETRVPEDESVAVPLIWAVEMYGPAEIEGLYTALRSLRWATEESNYGRSVGAWIEKQRAYGHGAAFFNIGLVCRPEDRSKYVGARNIADLPKDVKDLHVSIHQVTSSLTALLVGFHLQGDIVSSYQRELQRDRSTAMRPNRRFRHISVVTPAHRKQEFIDCARTRLREIARDWIRSQAPGFFSSINRPSLIPTAELVVTRSTPLLARVAGAAKAPWMDWRRLIVLPDSHSVWTSKKCKGLQFTWLRRANPDVGHHMVASLRTADFPKEARHYGSRDDLSQTYYCRQMLDGILVQSAADLLVGELSRELKETRSSMRSLGKERTKTLGTIDKIEDYFDRTIGSPIVVSEIAGRPKNEQWYLFGCEVFVMERFDGEECTYTTELVKRIHSRATRLVSEEESIRDHFGQLSSVLSVREGLFAQRRMERVTYIALFVAVLSLGVAILAIPAVSQWLSQSK